MQNLLIGPSGGGKSYEAAAFHVLPAVNKGRKVVTNMPLNVEYFNALCPGASDLIEIRRDTGGKRCFATVDAFGDPWRHPETGAGPLYVIDECHKYFPRGKTSVDVEEWFAEHRHETADLLLITQSYGKISKAIVDNMQLVYRVRKRTAFGDNHKYVRKVQDGIRGEVVNTDIRTYESKYFGLYRSHTKGGGEEYGASDVKPLWQHWTFKGAALMVLVFLVLQGYALFGGEKKSAQAKPVAVAVVHQDAPQTTAPGVPSPSPPPVQEVAQPRGPEQKMHPYQGYTMHLIALATGEKVYPGEDTPRGYLNGFIQIAKDGNPLNRVTFQELREAGYHIEYVSLGVVSVTYKGIDIGYVISDVPKVSLSKTLAKGD
jgi:zona occludens toxin